MVDTSLPNATSSNASSRISSSINPGLREENPDSLIDSANYARPQLCLPTLMMIGFRDLGPIDVMLLDAENPHPV